MKKIFRLYNRFKSKVLKNRILNSNRYLIKKNIVNLEYWTPPYPGENVGDFLSKVIIQRILERRGLSFKTKIVETRLLCGIGSIIHLAKEGSTVWGSGINGKQGIKYYSNLKTLDYRMVRGPLTRQIILNEGGTCPELYGDPALLLPILYPELTEKEKSVPYWLIPNLNESREFIKNYPEKSVLLPTLPWKEFIQNIQKAEFVISSSLHGIIIAEAYGIPAIRLTKQGSIENDFKYKDYYEGTGRKNFITVQSVKDGLNATTNKKIEIDTDKMLKAFPYDLWYP